MVDEYKVWKNIQNDGCVRVETEKGTIIIARDEDTEIPEHWFENPVILVDHILKAYEGDDEEVEELHEMIEDQKMDNVSPQEGD